MNGALPRTATALNKLYTLLVQQGYTFNRYKGVCRGHQCPFVWSASHRRPFNRSGLNLAWWQGSPPPLAPPTSLRRRVVPLPPCRQRWAGSPKQVLYHKSYAVKVPLWLERLRPSLAWSVTWRMGWAQKIHLFRKSYVVWPEEGWGS